MVRRRLALPLARDAAPLEATTAECAVDLVDHRAAQVGHGGPDDKPCFLMKKIVVLAFGRTTRSKSRNQPTATGAQVTVMATPPATETDLYWEARGSGPSILLIAGTPGDGGQFEAGSVGGSDRIADRWRHEGRRVGCRT